MKTHDNQKPFQCTVCNRGYNTAAALTSHMQNHKKDQQQQQQQQQNGHNNSNSSRTSSNNTPSPGAACPSFRCLQCGEIFRKPEELQVGLAAAYPSEEDLKPSIAPVSYRQLFSFADR
jgi:hypothetical protein